MRQYLIGGLAAGLIAGTLLASAPQASAGCQPFFEGQLCDGPIQPDGTWQRCEVNNLNPAYTKSECFTLGDGHFLPPFEPPQHIDP